MGKENITGLGLQSRALTAFTQLIWASETVRTRLLALLSSEGLTASQFGVLDALYHLGPHSQKDLGRHILKSGGNITMVVDNLEKAELVRRERSEDDRRFINVYITDKGEKLFSRVFPEANNHIEDEMNTLSTKELKELGRLCVKIASKGEIAG